MLLEDDGFDGGLEREIINPLAQDVLDEEPVALPDPNPPSNARAVIKYHHKQIGTLAAVPVPIGLFPGGTGDSGNGILCFRADRKRRSG